MARCLLLIRYTGVVSMHIRLHKFWDWWWGSCGFCEQDWSRLALIGGDVAGWSRRTILWRLTDDSLESSLQESYLTGYEYFYKSQIWNFVCVGSARYLYFNGSACFSGAPNEPIRLPEPKVFSSSTVGFQFSAEYYGSMWLSKYQIIRRSHLRKSCLLCHFHTTVHQGIIPVVYANAKCDAKRLDFTSTIHLWVAQDLTRFWKVMSITGCVTASPMIWKTTGFNSAHFTWLAARRAIGKIKKTNSLAFHLLLWRKPINWHFTYSCGRDKTSNWRSSETHLRKTKKHCHNT